MSQIFSFQYSPFDQSRNSWNFAWFFTWDYPEIFHLFFMRKMPCSLSVTWSCDHSDGNSQYPAGMHLEECKRCTNNHTVYSNQDNMLSSLTHITHMTLRPGFYKL
jgi:hypothetical protein